MPHTIAALIKDIVRQANLLKDIYTGEKEIPVNYAAVFSQNDVQYNSLLKAADKNRQSQVTKTPTTRPLSYIRLKDRCRPLKIVKIRAPDRTRPERGDADFTVLDYQKFKEECITKPQFKLIKEGGLRNDFEPDGSYL